MRICTLFLATSLLATVLCAQIDSSISSSMIPPNGETVSVSINSMRRGFYDRLDDIYDVTLFGDKLDEFKEELYSEFSKSVTKTQLESSDFVSSTKAAWYAERLVRGDCPKELEPFKFKSDKFIDEMIDIIFSSYDFESFDSSSNPKNPFFELLKEKVKECLRQNYVFSMDIFKFLMNLSEYLSRDLACQNLDLELSNKNFAPKAVIDLFKSAAVYNELSYILRDIVDATFIERLTRNIITLFNMYDEDSRVNGTPLRFISKYKIPNFVARVMSMLTVVQPTNLTFSNYDTPISMACEEILIKLVNKFESENGLTLKVEIEQKDLIKALRNFFADFVEGKIPVGAKIDGLTGFIKAVFEYYENSENINTDYAKVLNAYITQKHQVKNEL